MMEEPMVMRTFWKGQGGMEELIQERTGCSVFSGSGINYRKLQKTTILKSVDDTYYYHDDLSDPNFVKYTLFGHEGDQDIYEPKFNEPLLHEEKTKHIYLFRVRITESKKKEWIWYGKYERCGMEVETHIGKDYLPRQIIILHLRRISL